MALIVETGTGLSDANSYLSVNDADTYNTDHSDSALWSAASTEDKEKALRLATQYLNGKYDGRWLGTKGSQDQALAWPRSGVVDNDNFTLDSDALPQKLTGAIAELALKVIQGDTLFADQSEPGTIKREKKKLGPMSTEVEYMGGKSQVKKYPLVDALIRSLIESGDRMARG